jgi:hypothetical protein
MITARTFVLVLALDLRALISCDITKAIRTGVARGRTGRIRRATRPEAFRLYIIADVLALALCLGTAIWAITGSG